jgi:acyl-CoA thioester hydrolase
MIRAAGVDQVQAHHSGGGAYAVAECNIRYLKPARLGDDLVVVSTVEAVRGVSVLIHQRVMRGQEQLTDARVTAAFLTRDGRPQRQPREWAERFRAMIEGA